MYNQPNIHKLNQYNKGVYSYQTGNKKHNPYASTLAGNDIEEDPISFLLTTFDFLSFSTFLSVLMNSLGLDTIMNDRSNLF